jgi:hypothetical protein
METYEAGREMTFPELVRERQSAHKKAFTATHAKDTASGDFYRDVGSSINDILERHANEKLPGNVGTEFRGLNRDLSTAIKSGDMALRAQGGGSDSVRGLKAAAGIGLAGAGVPLANPGRDIPILTGLLASNPGVQMRGWQAVGAVSRAAAYQPTTALGRMLQKGSQYLPNGQMIGRTVAHGATQEGITAVQEAALRGDEEAVSEHYRQMLTNPDYNRAALAED